MYTVQVYSMYNVYVMYSVHSSNTIGCGCYMTEDGEWVCTTAVYNSLHLSSPQIYTLLKTNYFVNKTYKYYNTVV